MKTRILIGDDHINLNRDAYNALFPDQSFECTMPEDSENFVRLVREGIYDALVVDVNLDNWGLTLANVCSDIPPRKPVVLASAAWNTRTTHQQISDLLSNAKDIAFVGTVILQALTNPDTKAVNEYATSTRALIQLGIDRQQQRSSLKLENDDTLRILHLSDTQFGDPGTDPWSYQVGIEISRYVQKNLDQEIHLLAVTGDVTYSGLPSDYDTASEEIDTLAKQIWPGEKSYGERILLVPGNHDVNLRLAAANNIKFAFKPPKISLSKKPKDSMHLRYALTPFREFAWRLTKANSLMDDDTLCWICDSFRHLGVRIHFLNSVGEISCEQPNIANVPENGLDKLSKLARDTTDKIFNLALIHHGAPYTTNSKDGTEVAIETIGNWPKVAKYFNISDIRLMLHGHGHARQSKIVGYVSDTKRMNRSERKLKRNEFIEVMAPTTHLGDKLRPKNQRRGFNVIELTRRNGIVTEVTVAFYDLSENGPEPTTANDQSSEITYIL